MTSQQLMIAGTVLGVVFILLSGLAWTLTQYRRAPSRPEDDKPLGAR